MMVLMGWHANVDNSLSSPETLNDAVRIAMAMCDTISNDDYTAI